MRDIDTERHLAQLGRIATNVRGSIVNRGLILALMLVVADIALVAHYQPTVMLGVLQHTSLIPLFTGVVVNLAPALVAAAFWFCLGMMIANLMSLDPHRAVTYAAWTISTLVISGAFFDASVVPSFWGVFVLALIAAAAYAVHIRIDAKSEDDDVVPTILRLGMVLFVLATIGSAPDIRERAAAPFQPAETLELTGEEKPVVGFVLDVDPSGQWTTLLRESDRQLLVVPSESLTSRTPCELEHQGTIQPSGPWVPPKDSTPSC